MLHDKSYCPAHGNSYIYAVAQPDQQSIPDANKNSHAETHSGARRGHYRASTAAAGAHKQPLGIPDTRSVMWGQDMSHHSLRRHYCLR